MSERSNFENEWKDTFEGVELTPSTSVWSNVRAELATNQASQQGKRVVYWRWMAAASIVLLIIVGIGSFYSYQIMRGDYQMLTHKEELLLQNIALLEEEKCKTDEQVLGIGQSASFALTTDKNTPILDNEGYISDSLKTSTQLAVNDESSDEQDAIKNKEIFPLLNVDELGSSSFELAKNSRSEEGNSDKNETSLFDASNSHFEDKTSAMTSEGLEASRPNKETNGDVFENLDRIDVGLLAEVENDIQPKKVPDMMEIIKMQHSKKQNFREMWAGLSVGGGSFESNINRGESDLVALSDNQVELFSGDGQSTLSNAQNVNQSNVESPAFSYAISADFGKQVGRRTYVQGGVEYNRYSSGATSNLVTNNSNNDPQAFLRYENSNAFNKGALTLTEPYQLTNNYEYVAIPLKFGYQVLNRKIGVSLSSGVSTNFFLKNTLKDKSGEINDVKVGNGEESPYKPMNFSGLFGAEISYQWNEHYQFAIVPDYRFSLNGLTKSDAFFQSNPTALFLGFRFKYILK